MTLHMLLQEVSVTRAAKKLNLSTPAVSHALAKLRERFDDPLLVRAGRYPEAAEDLRRLLEMEPEFPNARSPARDLSWMSPIR